jgi:hypothetical protein
LWEEEGLTDNEVLEWTPQEFNSYRKPKEFHDNYVKYSNPCFSTPMKSSNGAGAASASGIITAVGPMMAQEFRQSVKRDKAHYETLKKDEGFRD